MKYKHYILKRKIEDVFIYPFIVIGKLVALIKPMKKEYETFFFFPFYHTGGAEKVHAMVTQATGNENCIIYFTRKSHDKNFYNDFARSGCTIKDISNYTDNKFLYFVNLVFRGIITGYINRQKQNPLVFNGQCNFGYKISPWIKKQIPQVELIHSFNTFSWIRIPFLPFISTTVMISQVRIEDHLRQYEKIEIPSLYKARIQYIVNGISLPSEVKEKDFTRSIKALYVGRGTEEKRVQLIAKIAEQSAFQKLTVEFVFMGEVKEAIPAELVQYCKLLGHKSDQNEIDEISNNHIL
ncbi:MAG: glycosyltransferase family 4 protein [Segetibacter sp.]|nr:glycosyltransferase family 4 protein [Segetibacter sp.]